MITKSRHKSSDVTPFPWLVASTELTTLWIVRMLVKCGRQSAWRSIQIEERLRLPKFEDTTAIFSRLTASLQHMEFVKQQFLLPQRLRANMDLLRKHLSLTQTECMLLALAVLLRVDNDLYETGSRGLCESNSTRSLAWVIGEPELKVGRLLEPSGRLCRSGLIELGSGSWLSDNFRLRHAGLRKLATSRFKTVGDMFGGILETPPSASLSAQDYPHLEPKFDDLCRLIQDTLNRKRTGTNVLLYGLPGTGKSELVRAIAHQVAAPLFEVSCQNEEGNPLNTAGRLASAATGMHLLGKRHAILCFDEVEAIFNDGSALFGKPSTAEHAKAWVNQMLEKNGVPMFWIANSIDGMDPAFVRRFDLAIRLDTPPLKQRLQLLERECGRQVSQAQLQRLARVDCITPALVTRAAKVARRITGTGGTTTSAGKLVESVIDGILQAQGHEPLGTLKLGVGGRSFKPDFCNSSEDLEALANGLARNMTGRICLYGPPGTGKTAFGQWLAEELARPLVVKRVSDLQSPFIGEMERKLANAFRNAKRDGAILQIDEVDSFLQDRRQAQRGWEISQVNEFLTQLENFDGLFIASTNLMDSLDQAALRRFDYKIRMDYLRTEQAFDFMHQYLVEWGMHHDSSMDESRKRLSQLRLTPGDFAVIERRHRISPFSNTEAVMNALCEEATISQRGAPKKMGFI